MMHGREKSDRRVVPRRPANNAERSATEGAEGRRLLKGSANRHSTRRTQRRKSCVTSAALAAWQHWAGHPNPTRRRFNVCWPGPGSGSATCRHLRAASAASAVASSSEQVRVPIPLLSARRESSLSSSEGAQPLLRPLHLVVRETEFCGQRLAGDFSRRMRENGPNSVRRPRHASLTDRNCEGFCRPGNRVGLPVLYGGGCRDRTDGHRSLASLQSEAARRGFSARNDLPQRMSKSLAGTRIACGPLVML